MLRVNIRSIVLAVVVSVLFLASAVRVTNANATRSCDLAADIALEFEDYPTSILLHRRLLRTDPTNALAHYHLGFAYGMVGQVEDEVHEYRLAARLGEHDWHLFLNLGLAYLERHQFDQATAAFQTAMLLGVKLAPFETILGTNLSDQSWRLK